MNEIHNFDEDLKKSHIDSNLPLWTDCYKQFFGSNITVIDHRQNGEHQKAGIDKSIILPNSKQILVDEKIRSKDYGDILLEESSSVEYHTPGWVVKPLRCDYIAYVIKPAERCYFLPTIPLQKSWEMFGEEWKQKYFPVKAINENYNGGGYTTLSWPIPVVTLYQSMAITQIKNFNEIK